MDPESEVSPDRLHVTLSKNLPLSVPPAFDGSRSVPDIIEDQRQASSHQSLPLQQTPSSLGRKHKEMMAMLMIDYNQMSVLRQAFLDRWEGEDLGLTKEEFQLVAKQSINMVLTMEEVERLYQQMDPKGTGRIWWRDYINSIGQTAQLRAYMAARAIKPLFQDKMQFIKTRHRDDIISIRFLPRLSMQSTKINYKSGRYLMLGRQGHISVWSLNLTFISAHYIGANEGLNPLFFVDMVVLYPSTLIAVTSTDRKITLYEFGSMGITEKYSIVALGNCVTCMDFWSDLRSRTTSLLVWGDTAGDIHALQMNVNRLGGIFDKDQNREIISRVVYADLAKHKFPTVRMYRTAGVHDDWVTAVKYIPENKAFLSSSRSSRQSMLYSDWAGKVEQRYFQSSKAVLCFDYNHTINVLVTGSLDCSIRVWNFFMGQRPVSTLTAHNAPVTHIALNPSTQHVMSVDKTRAIKVFDFKEGTILTACANAVISVWDLHTGKHMLQFQHFSPKSHFQDVPWAKDSLRLEVTAMALDPGQSSVLTGSNDGTVNVWNFSTGVLISYYLLPEHTLVTGLVVDRNCIFATGWFKYVYLLDRVEENSKVPPKIFSRYHTEEINCMTVVKGGLLATGSYDGDVVIVAKDTGHPVCVLNAGESHLPIPTKMKNDESDKNYFSDLLVDDDDTSSFSGWSEDELITTEDHSILRCIRISDNLVMVSNAITGDPVRIIKKPRVSKIPENDGLGTVYDALKGKKVSSEQSAANFRAYESSVEALVCLNTRKNLDISTATVITAGAEGWIRAWSLNPKGGLKGQFLATEYLGEAVKAMVTDSKNDFLITGDTMGYIKVWDIFPYCNQAAKHCSENDRQQRREQFAAMFIFLRSPFLRDKASEGFRQCHEFHKRAPPEESNPTVTLKTPSLLNVFRAHTRAITCMQYVDEHNLILSGANDCSVRVWTINGSFVGQCGDPWVKLPDMTAVTQPLRVLPRDIRRNASARTFRVIKTGCVPLWDRAVKLAKNYLEERRKAEEEQKKVFKGVESKTETQEEASMMTQPIPLGEEEPELPHDMRLCNVVNFDWKDPKRSHLLGKAFKPNLHHRHSPVPPVTIEDQFGMYPAYHKIDVIEISNMTRIPTPQLVKDMEVRRREEEEEAQRLRQATRRKTKASRPPPKGFHPAARRDRDATQPYDISQTPHGSHSVSESDFSCVSVHFTIAKAINNSAIDTNANMYRETPLDKLEDSDTDLLDLDNPCIKADSVHNKNAFSWDPSKKHLPTEEKNACAVSSMVKMRASIPQATFSGKESHFKNLNHSLNLYSKKSEETEDPGMKHHDLMDDIQRDVADVNGYMQKGDDHTKSDNCVMIEQSCILPPLGKAKRLSITSKPSDDKPCKQTKPQSKTPKLPSLWPKQVHYDRFKGTGLWFK